MNRQKLQLGGPFDGMTIERGHDGRITVSVVCDVHWSASYYVSWEEEVLIGRWFSMQYGSDCDE